MFLRVRTKAVADGSMSFFLDHFVKSRVSKMDYGILIQDRYNPTDPEHILRSENKYYCPMIEQYMLYGIFFTILSKVLVLFC